MKRSSKSRPLEVSIVEDTRDFAALEEEWEDLHRNSPLATPFQSWAWLYSWWESYGEDYELRLVTMRRADGLLVGLMPLMLKRLGGFGRLLFVGTGLTDYHDVLAREGWEDEVFKAGTWALEQMDSWQVADLQQLRPEAAAWGIFREWTGPKAHFPQLSYLMVDVKPWDELVASLSRKQRSNVRRTLRRAEADEVRRCEIAGPEDAEQAARRLVALHRELWQGRGIDPERMTGRYESFMAAAARRMIARGLGRISEFRQDGEVVLSAFTMFGNEFDGSYIEGASREALKRYQWSALTYQCRVDIAHSRNSAHLSLMDGETPYKLQWASKKVLGYRAILGRNPITWMPYTGYYALPSKAKWYIKSDSAPQWMRSAAQEFRVLRTKFRALRAKFIR